MAGPGFGGGGRRAELPVAVPKTQAAEVRHLLRMRDQARALIGVEAASVDDSPRLDAARDELRQQWQDYVRRFGPINRFTTRRTGRVDTDTGEEIIAQVMPPAVRLVTRSTFGTLVAALEVFDPLTQAAEPASLLQHRLIVPRNPCRGWSRPPTVWRWCWTPAAGSTSTRSRD